MRFYWRSENNPINSFKSWIEKLEPKNRQAGTSAPTLAVAWAGPVDLLGVVGTHPDLAKLSIRDLIVEEKASFDSYGGNPRNHDLVLRAETRDGTPVVVCVEAKAGEPLGATVAEQAKLAEKALAANPGSQAQLRLTDLVSSLCGCAVTEPRVQNLRYQLLTAWAGTLADAADAAHAVLALHEFRTDARPDDKSPVNNDELARFATEVFGIKLPGAEGIPWCVPVPNVAGVKARLLLRMS
jgi:hypothetical protein